MAVIIPKLGTAFRHSRLQMFYKIGVLKNFAKFSVLGSFFNKVAGLKRLHHKSSPMIFLKFSKTPYDKTPYTIKITYTK